MPPGRTRTALVALGLLVLTNGPVLYVANRLLGGALGWEEPFTREVFVTTAIATSAVVVLDPLRPPGRRLSRQSNVAGLAIVWFTVWAVLSSFWSLAPEVTRGRSLIYVGLAAFAWIVADLEPRRFRAALAMVAAVVMGASLIAVVSSDAVALDKGGNWRGIFTSRNSLAPLAGIAVLTGCSFAAERVRRTRVLGTVGALLGAVVMLGSGSRTAWFALLLAFGGGGAVVAARLGPARYGRRATGVCVAAGSAGLLVAGFVVASLWSEPTFAQRRTIWGLVWEKIGERPLHGHGWFSIWGVEEWIRGAPLLDRGSAHGSLFEVLLGLGVIGLLPFLAVAGLAVFGTARDAWRDPTPITWMWLSLVLLLVVENLTESFVLWFSYNWVLLMVAALRSGVGWPRRSGLRTPEARQPVSV